MIVGHQLMSAANALRAKPLDLGDDDSREQIDAEKALKERAGVYMQIVVSILVLAGGFFGLFVIKELETQKYFSALLGAVVGYWLR